MFWSELRIMRLLAVTVALVCCSPVLAEKPCAARQIPGQSVVCVCNATYCDQLTRQPPTADQYLVYTSSDGGSRFKKTDGSLETLNEGSSSLLDNSIELDPDTQYQSIEGFGGAVTDAAAINWKSLSAALQGYLVESYANETGLEYNILRVPIGGCDFSTRPYAYNELPADDTLLSNFTLAPEDYDYKIPLIKALMSGATAPVHVLGSTWSPPPWMKTNDEYNGFSKLRPEYFQTYADYHIKFLEAYAAAGVAVWAITTTNEPSDGRLNLVKFNTLGWTVDDLGEYIEKNLGPTLRNSSFKEVKIFTCDDQRYTVPFYFTDLVKKHPNALQYLSGVAVHWYGNIIAPVSLLAAVTKAHPEMAILATEACEGSYPLQKAVEPGSWKRAVSYITDILENLNNYVVGWIDWNICLNTEGGPNWVENFVDSPIIVNATAEEFIKQPMYYAMAHVAKFVPRGSRRIELTIHNALFTKSLKGTAFLTPRNTVVLIVYNAGGAKSVTIKCGQRQASVSLEADSITTVEFQK